MLTFLLVLDISLVVVCVAASAGASIGSEGVGFEVSYESNCLDHNMAVAQNQLASAVLEFERDKLLCRGGPEL